MHHNVLLKSHSSFDSAILPKTIIVLINIGILFDLDDKR